MICSCGDTIHTRLEPALGHDWVPHGTYAECSRCGATKRIKTRSEGSDLNEIDENVLDRCEPEDYGITIQRDESDEVEDQIEEIEAAGDECGLDVGDHVQELRSGGQIIDSETIVSYAYIYAGDKLLQEKITTGQTIETHNFFYDNTGTPYAILIDSTVYYYVTNLQGDVLGLIDSSGTTVASYTYDPFGKVLSATGSIAEKNPLRYRGYYYDSESGLYYLLSRYYDPNTCRFINADSQISADESLIGLNLFSYCANDPVNKFDPLGKDWWHWAIGAAIVVTCAIATVVICGGIAAAATAVYMVCNGAAAATTAATLAAGAFVGSAVVYGLMIAAADANSSSIQEFYDQGNWSTVIGTGLGGLIGASIVAGLPQIASNPQSQAQHLSGTGHASDFASPFGSYTKYDSSGRLVSYTMFDSQAREYMRIEFVGRPHANTLPHIHLYKYLEMGGRKMYTFDLHWHLID
jgi:RHS repeat-associated protein